MYFTVLVILKKHNFYQSTTTRNLAIAKSVFLLQYCNPKKRYVLNMTLYELCITFIGHKWCVAASGWSLFCWQYIFSWQLNTRFTHGTLANYLHTCPSQDFISRPKTKEQGQNEYTWSRLLLYRASHCVTSYHPCTREYITGWPYLSQMQAL